MPRAARVRAVLLSLASCAAAGTARAEPGEVSTPFRLSYEAAPEGCPNATAFHGAIRARTERAQLAEQGEQAVAIAVRIARAPGDSVMGRVEIREPDGARQERTVQSATCKEVAQALALVVALYLDPDATSSPEAEPVEPPPAPPPPPPPPRPPERPKPRPALPASAPPRESAIAFGAGVGLGIVGGVGPSGSPLGRAFGEVTIDGEAIARVLSWARPSARLSIDVATGTGDVAAGSQRYVLVAGALRICPVDVAIVHELQVGPCAGLQAGVHEGRSVGGAECARASEAVGQPPCHAALDRTCGEGGDPRARGWDRRTPRSDTLFPGARRHAPSHPSRRRDHERGRRRLLSLTARRFLDRFGATLGLGLG